MDSRGPKAVEAEETVEMVAKGMETVAGAEMAAGGETAAVAEEAATERP